MGKKIKNNYKPWYINEDASFNYQEKLELLNRLLEFAILAPSSHNTQPWLFKIINNKIHVFLNKKKLLSVGDPENRLAFASIGCAIANIKIAADYYGYNSNTELVDYDDVSGLIAVFSFERIANKDNNSEHLIHFIKKRSTNRLKYTESKIPKVFLAKIAETKKIFSDDAEVDFFSDSYLKQELGRIIAQSAAQVMEKKGFLKELSKHIRNNLTNSKSGIPAFGMGIPTLISFIAPFLVRFINMDKLSMLKNTELFAKHTPAIGVIAMKQDNFKNWLIAGELYEIIALTAESCGLKTSVWGAPTVDRETARIIKDKLFLDGHMGLVFRIGFPISTQQHSPRYSLDEVVIKN